MLNVLGRSLELVELMEGGQEPSHVGNLEQRRRKLQASAVATRNVEVARNSLDQEDGNSSPRTVVGLVAEAVAVHQGHGLDGAHHAGNLINLLDGNARDLACPLGRELLHVLSKLVEAVDPVIAEIVIVEVLANDDMQDGQRQGTVGTRTDGDPDVRMRAERVEHRANVDGNHAAVALIETVRVLTTGLVDAGVLLVVAPANQQVGLVNLARERGGRTDGAGLRGFALVPADAVVAPVGRTVQVEEALTKNVNDLGGLAGEDEERLGTILFGCLLQGVGDGVESLVPADALKLAASLLTHELHGVKNTGRVVHELGGRVALRAKRAGAVIAVVARPGVALDVLEDAVLNRAQCAAVRLRDAAHLAPHVLDLDIALRCVLGRGYERGCSHTRRGSHGSKRRDSLQKATP